MIVVDASAVIEVVLRTRAAAAVERRVHDMRETLHAPHLIDIEVAHVIRRSAAIGEIAADRGLAAIEDLADFPCTATRMSRCSIGSGSCGTISLAMTLPMSRWPKYSVRRS